MEKIVEIDIDGIDDLFERYNKKRISKDLIRYLIDSTPTLKRRDTLRVIINNNLGENISCAELIKKALDAEVASNEYKFIYTNKKQMLFFVLGVFALGISTFIEMTILKEIILIGAWVVLWDMVELELQDDISNRKKKYILKKLLTGEFEEIKKQNYNDLFGCFIET